MATKVSLENNILKIDNGVKKIYYNAAWCSMSFDNTNVIIKNNGLKSSNTTKIPFASFQDGNGTDITTEETISAYLSDKIG